MAVTQLANCIHPKLLPYSNDCRLDNNSFLFLFNAFFVHTASY